MSLRSPSLKLYQQLLIVLGVLVIALAGISVAIYNINQNALQKELLRYSQQAGSVLLEGVQAELNWQQRQARWIAVAFSQNYTQTHDFIAAAGLVFSLVPNTHAVGLYDANGERLHQRYADANEQNRLPQAIETIDAGASDAWQVQALLVAPEKIDLQIAVRLPSGQWLLYRSAFNAFLEILGQYKNAFYQGIWVFNAAGKPVAGTLKNTSPKSFLTDAKILKSLHQGVKILFGHRVYIKLPHIHWGVVIESPYALRQKYVRRARSQSLWLTLGFSVLMGLLSMAYVYRISRNFRQLIKGTRAIASGNYARRIRLLSNWTTPYEIIYLSGEFNRMARKLNAAWLQLKAANKSLAQLDDVKSTLIDSVSHELRTPLTSIKGYASQLLRANDQLEAPARLKALKTIRQQASRLERLVEDLLAVPELDQHYLSVYPDRVDLWAMATHCAHLLHEQSQQSGLLFHLNAPADPLPDISADPDRLEQVLMNILENALKYSLASSTITLQLHALPNGSQLLHIENACAETIAPELLNTLFDKFTRLDSTTTRTTRGTGLGLYISRGLVTAMGGTMQLGSANQRFWVDLTFPPVLPSASLLTDITNGTSLTL